MQVKIFPDNVYYMYVYTYACVYIWRDRQYRKLKKLFFSPLSKCPIDLFGPWANRTILRRLHGASFAEDTWARGSPPRRRATARYRRECKPPEPWVFSKNLPGFQKFFKSLLCQNSQISLNCRSGYLTIAISKISKLSAVLQSTIPLRTGVQPEGMWGLHLRITAQ